MEQPAYGHAKKTDMYDVKTYRGDAFNPPSHNLFGWMERPFDIALQYLEHAVKRTTR